MELMIAGDLAPTKSNIDLFNNAKINDLLGEDLLALWEAADIRIFNLEVPLVDREDPIDKCGPRLISATSAIKGIKALNPWLVCLANNHIMDQGVQGLLSTINLLKEKEIAFIGAGANIDYARRPYIIEEGGIRLGIYACAEHEFSIAGSQMPGANPFDPLESLDDIEGLKKACDYLIVLYHGGKEHYPYPSPYLQRVCRKLAQKGADLIICQHSHCIGCYEEYDKSTIIYGQGNFIFDYSDSDYWKTSLLLNVKIDKELEIEYIPFVKKDNKIRLAKGEKKQEILSAFEKRTKEIQKEGFIEERYEELAEQNIQSYLRRLSASGKWLTRLDYHLLKGRLIKHRYNKRNLLAIENSIECETHRELLIRGLRKISRKE